MTITARSTLSSMVILMSTGTVTTIQDTVTHTVTITSTVIPILTITATRTKRVFTIRRTPPISIGARCPASAAR